MAMIMIMLFVGLFIGVLIGYIYHKYNQLKIIEINNTITNQLKEEEAELNSIIQIKTQEIDHLQETAILKAEKYLAEESDRISPQITQLNNALIEAKTTYENSLKTFEQSLESESKKYQKQQEALIAIMKRQEELEKESDYYRLLLDERDKEDIIILLKFAEDLHHPEILKKLIWSTYYKPSFDLMVGRVLENKTISGIYKITSKATGKSYIGQSTNIKNRWTDHIKSALEISSIAKNQLYSAMKQDGIDNFTFEIIEQCPKEELNQREKYYISFFKTNDWGLNMTSGNT